MSNHNDNQGAAVFPFLHEDTSKPFLQTMFECLLNIMKTSKITQQYENDHFPIFTRQGGRDFESESKNENQEIEEHKSDRSKSPNEEVHFKHSNHDSNSEYDSLSDPDEIQPESSSRYTFFSQIKDKNADLYEMLAKLKRQREDLARQHDDIIDELEKIDGVENEIDPINSAVVRDIIDNDITQTKNRIIQPEIVISQRSKASSHSKKSSGSMNDQKSTAKLKPSEFVSVSPIIEVSKLQTLKNEEFDNLISANKIEVIEKSNFSKKIKQKSEDSK